MSKRKYDSPELSVEFDDCMPSKICDNTEHSCNLLIKTPKYLKLVKCRIQTIICTYNLTLTLRTIACLS